MLMTCCKIDCATIIFPVGYTFVIMRVTTTHADHKFSITIRSDDLAVVYCLRALAEYSQKTGQTKIAWGNTTNKDWKRDGHRVTFHFSDPNYRNGLVSEAKRLLPQDKWEVDGTNDNDPAKKPDRARRG